MQADQDRSMHLERYSRLHCMTMYAQLHAVRSVAIAVPSHTIAAMPGSACDLSARCAALQQECPHDTPADVKKTSLHLSAGSHTILHGDFAQPSPLCQARYVRGRSLLCGSIEVHPHQPMDAARPCRLWVAMHVAEVKCTVANIPAHLTQPAAEDAVGARCAHQPG